MESLALLFLLVGIFERQGVLWHGSSGSTILVHDKPYAPVELTKAELQTAIYRCGLSSHFYK
jgi:hypothetical protein